MALEVAVRIQIKSILTNLSIAALMNLLFLLLLEVFKQQRYNNCHVTNMYNSWGSVVDFLHVVIIAIFSNLFWILDTIPKTIPNDTFVNSVFTHTCIAEENTASTKMKRNFYVGAENLRASQKQFATKRTLI